MGVKECMDSNTVRFDDEVIWIIKPWIIPSLAEESIMAAVVFGVSYLSGVYFGSLYEPIFGINFITLVGLGLALIWTVNAFHLLLVRSTSRYTLRRSGLEIRTGILNRRIVLVSPKFFADVVVIQSILGKIMGSGELFVQIHEAHAREGIMKRVRNPFIVEKDIRGIMSA